MTRSHDTGVVPRVLLGGSNQGSTAGICFSLVALSVLSSCSHSPSQNIVGSFFPAWMLCAVLGCGVAAVTRVVLGVVRLDQHVLAPPLAYPAIAIAFAAFAWLHQFGQ